MGPVGPEAPGRYAFQAAHDIVLTDADTIVTDLTIDAPGPGIIHANATIQINLPATTGYSEVTCGFYSPSQDPSLAIPWTTTVTNTSDYQFRVFPAQAVLPVDSAGSYNIQLVCYAIAEPSAHGAIYDAIGFATYYSGDGSP